MYFLPCDRQQIAISPGYHPGTYVYRYNCPDSDRATNNGYTYNITILADYDSVDPYNGEWHIMGAVKYRAPLFLQLETQDKIKEIFRAVADRFCCKYLSTKVEEIAIAPDHVHLLVSIVSIGKVQFLPEFVIAEIFKKSEEAIREQLPEIYNYLDYHKVWGGMSAKPITDAGHHNNTVQYIRAHNTQAAA